MMASIRASLSEFGWRRFEFSLVVLVFCGLFGLLIVLLLQPAWFGWLPYNISAFASAHFGSADDRIHELAFSLIIGTAVLGMLAQLRKPSENVAGQLMALIAWVALLLASVLTNNWVPFLLVAIFAGVTLLATILHPKGRGLFSWFSVSRVNWVLLALVIIAAVPLLAFAATNIGLQREGGAPGGLGAAFGPGHRPPAIHGGGAATNQESSQDQPSNEPGGAATGDEAVQRAHVAIGHFKNMAAFSFMVIGVGLLASLRPYGWRLSAWVAGLLPAFLGLASVVFPDLSSSLSLVWALAAIHWGGVFVAAAELARSRLRLSIVEPSFAQ